MHGGTVQVAVRIAVIGDFQIGKSSLVNCLLAETLAETGKGFFPTTEEAAEYPIAPGVVIVDTPGFNDPGFNGSRRELESMTEGEIAKADVILFIKTEKILGERDKEILRKADGKKIIVLFNCTDRTVGWKGWIPEEKGNADTCDKIRHQLVKEGLDNFQLCIDGKNVVPVNILWAQFGLGLPVDDVQRNNITEFAVKDLKLNAADSLLRAELLRRSGFSPVQDFIKNLPLELLKDAAANPKREIDRIVNRFAEEFKKRWNAA